MKRAIGAFSKGAFCAMAGLAVSCAPVAKAGQDPTSLAGTRWVVRDINGDPAPPPATARQEPAATIRFGTDGSFGGTSACNHTGGATRWEPGGVFSHMDAPIIMTTMGCGKDAGVAFGDRFWTLMQHAKRWSREGDRLVIRSTDGSTARLDLSR